MSSRTMLRVKIVNAADVITEVDEVDKARSTRSTILEMHFDGS